MADGSYQKTQFNKPDRPRYALNDFKMTLQGVRAEGGLKPQGIRFEIDSEGVRIIASTGIDGDEDYGQIKATVSLQDAFMVMGLLEMAPRRFHPGKHEDVAIAGGMYNRQTNKREVKHQMTLRVGRTDAGVIYLQVASWKTSRPKVTVEMLPSNFARLIDQDGSPAAGDKVSELVAVQYAKMMSSMMPLALTTEYSRVMGESDARKAAKAAGGGQGGGGGGGYNNGGGNRQAPAPSPAPSGGGFDFGGDDLPM